MKLPRTLIPSTSIKTRASLVAVGIVLVTTFIVTVIGQYLYQQDRKARIVDDQLRLVQQTASLLDQKLASRATLLRTFAQGIPGDILRSAERLNTHLVRQEAMQEAFDNVAFVNIDGDIVTSLAGAAGARINVHDRQYFVDTVMLREGVISKPIKSRLSGRPMIIMTQPVADAAGRLALVILASIELHGDSFLGELAGARVGDSGYLFIMDSDGVLIEHPRRERVLQNVRDAAGSNVATDRALAGFEGTVEATTRAGVPAMYAYRRMRQTNWIVGAVVPRDEALAPLVAARRDIFFGSLVLALAAGALAWWAMRRQFATLARLHERIRAAREDHAYVPPEQPYRDDEIGEFARAFDDLLHERHASRRALQESEAALRNVLTNAGDAFVSCDVEGFIIEWNRAAEETFGWRRAEVLGRPLANVLVPLSMRAAHLAGMRRFAQGGDGPLLGKRMQMRALHRDGHEIPVEMSVVPVRVGERLTANAFLRDISARLEAEERMAQGERRLRMIADNLPALVAYVDSALRYQFVNRAYQDWYGIDPRTMLGRTAREVFGEEGYAVLGPKLEAALRGERVDYEFRSEYAGFHGHLDLHYLPDLDPDGSVRGVYVMAHDVTERAEARRELAQSEQRLRLLTDSLPALISYIDSAHTYRFCNATYERWLGLKPDAILGKTLDEVHGVAPFADRRDYVERALGGKPVEFEVATTVDGKTRNLQVSYVPDVDAHGKVHGIYTISMDITRQKDIERQLIQQARFDALTGLPNRHQLEERLAEAVARSRRSGQPLALLFIDIDHFKGINDSLGHGAGDLVLQEFARRLQACVRLNDVVARLAGDEFIVILEDLRNEDELRVVCDKILGVMRADWQVEGHALPVTASIGAAWAAQQKPAAADLMAQADRALYRAKDGGRNGYAVESC